MEELKTKYAELAKILGDIEFNIEVLTERRKVVVTQLHDLNRQAEFLKQQKVPSSEAPKTNNS
jgi:hypothetical protein